MSSRRDFIKTAGTLAVASAIPAMGGAQAATKGNQVSMKGRKVTVDSEWDVIVVGGGPAGCTAAISAAREGARTLLIEAMGQLGGMGTAGMVPAWCPFSDGEKIIYRGLAERIFTRSRNGVPHESKNHLDWVNIDPEQLMRVYDLEVAASGAQVLFFSRLAAVEKDANNHVDAIIVANKNGLTAFKAKVYVDATGDGDLATWAGAETLKTDVLQSSTLCFSLANVDTYAFRYECPNLQSNDPNTPINRGIAEGRFPKSMEHICLNLVGPNVVQFNAGHIDTDATDPKQLSKAMQDGRMLAYKFLKAFQEVAPKAFGNAFLVKTASLMGIRDSRRVVGDYLFTGDDWRARRQFEDEIGRNSYYIDIHKSGAVPVRYKKGESHGIPYRCLTPKGLSNVLVAGRCISTDEEAFGSLRVMPPCLVTGEAAGMAAFHAIQQGHEDVHKVDTQHLRARLKEEGQYFL